MMSEQKTLRQNIEGWLKQPATWTSLVAFVISVFTFYSTNLDDGTIQIYLPQQLGIELSSNSTLCFRVPIVLFNTAPQNKWKTIRDMTINAKINGESAALNHNWNTLLHFESKDEFEKNFPKLAQANASDYAVYESRVVPISISGKQSASKLVDFDCVKHNVNLNGPFTVDLAVNLTTMEGQTYNSAVSTYDVTSDSFKNRDSGLYFWSSEVKRK